MTTFESLGLGETLLQAVADNGYETPTPVQAQAIPIAVRGRDILAGAQTGTGKTAAFTLPILEQLRDETDRSHGRPPRALILAPTRELALQIEESLAAYAKNSNIFYTVIIGGVSQNPQVKALKRGVDIVVATPGRLIDLENQGHVDLSAVRHFVLDEADRMLDMGFVPAIRKIEAKLPDERQTLLFSATLPNEIMSLANEFLDNPERVQIEPESPVVDRIDQRVMFVQKGNKKKLLIHLLNKMDVERAIVFSRTKHGANRLVKQLDQAGFSAAPIHGNKSQNARQRALNNFRDGKVTILVATDIAARGIDVDDVSHVFNYDLPNISETYVHRIGRTARAGREGVAIAFCSEQESDYLRDIQKLMDIKIDVDTDHDWHHAGAIPQDKPNRGGGKKGKGNNTNKKRRRRRRNRRSGNRNSSRQD